jgi:hypothetical protein
MYRSSYRRFQPLVLAILASVLVIGIAILPRAATAKQASPVTAIAQIQSSSGALTQTDDTAQALLQPAFTFSEATQPVVNNAVPDRTAVFTHTLTNDGNGTDIFNITVTSPGGWTADPIEPISLDRNESRQVVVHVHVPAGQGAGSYPFDVTAQSSSTPAPATQTRQDTVVVVGAAVPQLSPAQTKNASPPLPTTVAFTHILTNTGNQAGTFTLSASVVGAPAGWSAVPSQPSCSLVQNASCTFTVNVTVPDGSAAGLTGVVVTASIAGPPPASDSVTDFVQGSATGLLDTFDRANGGVGSNWEGLTDISFYKLAANKLDVQLGGPLIWKPTSFGTSQEVFVTLSAIDTRSRSQGVLLKVQTGNIPNAGAISVVYDAKAQAVRVSTLRLGQNGTWTLYPSTAATFANGDMLGARAKADGMVQIYKNGTLLTTVALSAADRAFFNVKGGKIGIWTAGAPNAILDNFGGGTVTP